jgi:hypothetical protein
MHFRSSLRIATLLSLSCFAVLAACSSPQPTDDVGGSDATDNLTQDSASDAGDALNDATDAPPIDAGADATTNDATDAPSDATPLDATDGSVLDALDVPARDTFFDVPLPDSFIVDGATVCNSTLNDGPVVTVAAGTGTIPASTGGSIALGHYQLTSLLIYGAPVSPGVTVQQALDITSPNIFAVTQSTAMPMPSRTTDSYTVTGTTINTTTLCPAGSTSALSYTATPTQLVVTQVMTSTTVVATYALH